MLPVAVEYGFDARFPTTLLDPETNIDLGATILARHIARHGGDRNAGLLRYNGGGDAGYPARVLAASVKFREALGDKTT